MMMRRGPLIVLTCMAAALGGCATWPAATDPAASSDARTSPADRAPSALPPNAFGPEPGHYFGTGGP